MDLFEYKFFPLPNDRLGPAARTVDGSAFAPELQRQINLITASGWQFVGHEEMPVERRRWIILRGTAKQDVLVFRRPISQTPAPRRQPAPPPVEADSAPKVTPKRIERNFFPDRLRPVTTGRARPRPQPLA